MRCLVIGLVALFASGCSFLQPGAAAVVDAVGSYCEHNPTDAGREAARNEFHGELVSEDIELCLGCPGADTTYCVGPVKTKVDDPA